MPATFHRSAGTTLHPRRNAALGQSADYPRCLGSDAHRPHGLRADARILTGESMRESAFPRSVVFVLVLAFSFTAWRAAAASDDTVLVTNANNSGAGSFADAVD